jgi:hypothetical protein
MFLDDICLAFDNGLGIISNKGLTPYQCWLTTITKGLINYNDTPNQAVRTDTRITVSDGYAHWILPDGYKNPQLSQVSGQQLVLSGGALTIQFQWNYWRN